MKMNSLLNEGIDFVLKNNKKNILLGEDIKDPYGGAFRITKNLSTKYSNQVFQMPISEPGFVGLATGMAFRGYNSIVEIMFCDFITLITDILINTTSKFAQLSESQMSGKVLIRTPSGGKRGYGPIHSQTLEKIFFGWPEINVYALNRLCCPKKIFQSIFEEESKVKLLIENKIDYTKDLFDDLDIKKKGFNLKNINKIPLSILKNHEDKSNPDVVFCCYGGVVTEVLDAAYNLMLDHEISSNILVPTKISPIEISLIEEIKKTSFKKIIIVEDGYINCGWGSHLITSFVKNKSKINLSDIEIFGPKNHLIPANFNLEKEFFPNSKSIYKNVLNSI